jgi:hypothetical protein
MRKENVSPEDGATPRCGHTSRQIRRSIVGIPAELFKVEERDSSRPLPLQPAFRNISTQIEPGLLAQV